MSPSNEQFHEAHMPKFYIYIYIYILMNNTHWVFLLFRLLKEANLNKTSHYQMKFRPTHAYCLASAMIFDIIL